MQGQSFSDFWLAAVGVQAMIFSGTPIVPSKWIGGNRLFKSYDRGTSWVASADLTKQVDRCKVTVMGVAGDKSQLSKNDGLSAYSTIIAVCESPVMPGVVWAGTDDGNLQVEPRRRRSPSPKSARTSRACRRARSQTTIHSGSRASMRRTSTPARRTSRSTGTAATICIRTSFVTRDYGKTFTERHGRPARVRQRAGRSRRSEEQGPAVRRHRVRALHLAQRRQALGEVHERLPDRAHGRHLSSIRATATSSSPRTAAASGSPTTSRRSSR